MKSNQITLGQAVTDLFEIVEDLKKSNQADTTKQPVAYLRFKEIFGRGKIIPVSHSTDYRLIKSKKFPAPIRVNEKIAMWSAETVNQAIKQMAEKGGL
jgi:predicted DNA-binding transcriptional regulator AlpA